MRFSGYVILRKDSAESVAEGLSPEEEKSVAVFVVSGPLPALIHRLDVVGGSERVPQLMHEGVAAPGLKE